jgi:hypothetical protein
VVLLGDGAAGFSLLDLETLYASICKLWSLSATTAAGA